MTTLTRRAAWTFAVLTSFAMVMPSPAPANDKWERIAQLGLNLLQNRLEQRNRGGFRPGRGGNQLPSGFQPSGGGRSGRYAHSVTIENFGSPAIDFSVELNGREYTVRQGYSFTFYSSTPIAMKYKDGVQRQTVSGVSGTYKISASNGRWVVAPEGGQSGSGGDNPAPGNGGNEPPGGNELPGNEPPGGGQTQPTQITIRNKHPQANDFSLCVDGGSFKVEKNGTFSYAGRQPIEIKYNDGFEIKTIANASGEYEIAVENGRWVIKPTSGSSTGGDATAEMAGLKFKETDASGMISVYQFKTNGKYDMFQFAAGTPDAMLIEGNHEARLKGDSFTLVGATLTLSPATAANQQGEQEGPFTMAVGTGNVVTLAPLAGGATRTWTNLP